MSEEYFKKLEALRKQNEYFVEATVVRREVPSSGKSGDKAIIDKNGVMTGWIGGGCVQGIVLKESEDALKTGKARLVRVGKFPSPEKQEGVKEYKMTCMSEGTVEIFIDPYLPPPHLVVIGKSLIAKSLVKIAKAAGYRVTAVAPEATPTTFEKVDELITQMKLDQVKMTIASAIVACTQGQEDEKALELIVSQPCFYKGFVASKKKMSGISANLLAQGFHQEQINAVHSPSGIDINAKQPDEVAISILAEIILEKNNRELTGFGNFAESNAHEETPKSKYYINPVCGIPVDMNNPKHIVAYHDEKVYFCCDGCKTQFEANPDKYMKARTTSAV